jgi:hypothetical protein
MRNALCTTPAVSALTLVTACLASMIPVSRAFTESMNYSTALVSTIELNSTTGEFKSLFPVDGKNDDALWFMSKMIFSDSDDLSAPNLTFYSSTAFYNFSPIDYKVEEPACEVHYAGVKCSKCTLCAKPSSNTPRNPWSLEDGAVFFDCASMQDLRLCRGITGTNNDKFESGSICDENSKMMEFGSFRGVASCFEEYISPAPSEAPSAALLQRKRRRSSGEKRTDYAKLLATVSGILAWIAVL